jgi:hypothetical protein
MWLLMTKWTHEQSNHQWMNWQMSNIITNDEKGKQFITEIYSICYIWMVQWISLFFSFCKTLSSVRIDKLALIFFLSVASSLLWQYCGLLFHVFEDSVLPESADRHRFILFYHCTTGKNVDPLKTQMNTNSTVQFVYWHPV